MSPSGSSGHTQNEGDICRSMKVNQESKTPYSDATQVRNNGHIFLYNSYTIFLKFQSSFVTRNNTL